MCVCKHYAIKHYKINLYNRKIVTQLTQFQYFRIKKKYVQNKKKTGFSKIKP